MKIVGARRMVQAERGEAKITVSPKRDMREARLCRRLETDELGV
jgi:hypothetical protein